MLNQQIQRHPLKPKSVIRGMHAFSIHKLPEKIDYGDDVRILENKYKFNETPCRKWIFKWVITRYVTSTLIINTLIWVKYFGDISNQVIIARYIVSIFLHMLAMFIIYMQVQILLGIHAFHINTW